MKIAQLSSLIERVPPKKYGGAERVVHYLTEELVKRGHDVTLLASGDSETKGNLTSVSPHSLREMYISDTSAFTILNVTKAYKNSSDFDIIHNHVDYFALPSAHLSSTPTITTLHGPITLENKNIYKEYNKLHLVSISNAQRGKEKQLGWLSTIYNGIPIERFPFSEKHKDYLLFVGRISLEKGTHIAMDIAMALDKKLIIAAKLDKADIDYFNQYVAPRLYNDKIKWVGEVTEKERNKLMSEAMCMLHPITWSEPFGMTIIEAMACGCPVVAFNKGSIPELIVSSKTGFIVEKEVDMTKAIEKVKSISRKACRRHVEKNFNLKKMVDSYEKLYYEIVNDQRNKQSSKTT
jgi:glycosyltransferase involved in cell wall biosynthesis